jgi:hypothetical protein
MHLHVFGDPINRKTVLVQHFSRLNDPKLIVVPGKRLAG